MAALAIVATALASSSLVSCSRSGKEKPKIGIAMGSFDDPAASAIRRSIETEALDKAELAMIDGQNQQNAQDLQINSFFDRKLAAIAIEPIDGSAIGPIIAKAKERKTPIVFFDRLPSNEAMQSWDKVFYVGSSEAEGGKALGEMLADFWKTGPAVDRAKDGVLQYAWLGEDAAEREEAIDKALSAAGIKSERTPGSETDAIICEDLKSTLGALDAHKGAKKPAIFAWGEGDPPQAVMDALESGALAGAIYADAASQGKAVFSLAYALARGTDPAKAGWSISDAKYVWVPYLKFRAKAAASGR